MAVPLLFVWVHTTVEGNGVPLREWCARCLRDRGLPGGYARFASNRNMPPREELPRLCMGCGRRCWPPHEADPEVVAASK